MKTISIKKRTKLLNSINNSFNNAAIRGLNELGKEKLKTLSDISDTEKNFLENDYGRLYLQMYLNKYYKGLPKDVIINMLDTDEKIGTFLHLIEEKKILKYRNMFYLTIDDNGNDLDDNIKNTNELNNEESIQ